MKSGIYTITCLVNNKIYVGKSIDIKERIRQHKIKLRNGSHNNLYLLRNWVKYGEQNFKFELLEEYEECYLDSFENYWCNLLHTHNKNFGFNLQLTSPNNSKKASEETKLKLSVSCMGRIPWNKGIPRDRALVEKTRLYHLGRKRSLETVQKIAAKTSKPILQYDLEGNFVKEWKSSAEAQKILNTTNIASVISGRYLYVGGFHFIRKPINNQIDLKIIVPKRKKPNRIKYSEQKLSKKISIYDLEDNFIKSFPSINYAATYMKLGRNYIKQALNGKRSSYKNLKWRYD